MMRRTITAAPEFPSVQIAIEVAEGMALLDGKSPATPPEVPHEIGALTQWRREVAAGGRRKVDIDALSRAACHEANARDELSWGMQSAARQSRFDAATIIVEAVAEHAAA